MKRDKKEKSNKKIFFISEENMQGHLFHPT